MVAILFTCILCWIWLQILISELVSSAFNGINSIEYFGLKKYTCFYKQTKQIHNNGQQQTHPLNMVNNQHSHLTEMHPVQYIQAHKMFKLSISIRFHRLRLCFHAFYHMQDFKTVWLVVHVTNQQYHRTYGINIAVDMVECYINSQFKKKFMV